MPLAVIVKDLTRTCQLDWVLPLPPQAVEECATSLGRPSAQPVDADCEHAESRYCQVTLVIGSVVAVAV